MLTENDVVNHVVQHLQTLGHTTVQELSTTQKGIDIITTSQDGTNYYIEAKGSTSSREGSGNYGNPFNGSQVYTHIATAITKCFQNYEAHKNEKYYIGMALPNDREHLNILPSIKTSLINSNIHVLLVDNNGNIENYI